MSKRESTPEYEFAPLTDRLRLSWMLKSIYEKQEGVDLSNVLVSMHSSLANLNPRLSTSDPSSSTVPTHSTELDTKISIDFVKLEVIAIQFLSSYSQQPNWNRTLSFPNEYGQTLAHISTMSGCVQLLQHLIAWGIDLNVPDVTGTTALHCAYLRGDVACASLLIRSGVNQLVLDDLGRSPAEVGPWMLDPKLGGRETTGGYLAPFDEINCGDYDTAVITEEDSARATSLLVQRWALQVENGRDGGSCSPTISEQSLRWSDVDVWSQVSCVGTNSDSRLVLLPPKQIAASDIIPTPLAEATNDEPLLLSGSRMTRPLILPSPPRALPSYAKEGTLPASAELARNGTSRRGLLPHTAIYQPRQGDDQNDCDKQTEFEDRKRRERSPLPVARASPSPVTSSADMKTAQLSPVLPPGLFSGRNSTNCSLGSRYSTPGAQEYFGRASSDTQIRPAKARNVAVHGSKTYTAPVPAARGRRRGR